MNKNLVPITDEKDLEIYEKRLRANDCNSLYMRNASKRAPEEHFLCHKGKLLKVETAAGHNTRIREGRLIEVGEGFIVLKSGCVPVSVMIPLSNIVSVTVIHTR